MIAMMSSMNCLGNHPAKSATNGPIKTQSQDANKLNQKDAAQEDRSEYEQALSKVSGADEGQSKEEVLSVKDEESSTAKTDSDNDQESTDNPEAGGVQPGIIPPPVSGAERGLTGEHANELAAHQSTGKSVPDVRINQAEPIGVLQSLKYQTKTAEGAVTTQVQGVIQEHADAKSTVVKSAVVTATGDAASSADSASAVKAAMALANSTTVKNTMPLTLEGALASSHQYKNTLDVTSLRVEQQVGDVSQVDRLLAQPTPTKYEWSMVKLDSQQQSWSKQLCNVLQDRIEMQINQHIKQAKIRLDPPELGRLDLTVRFDGDRLSVVVNSSNASVREALQDSLANLRGGLTDQFGAGVDVNVGGDSLPKQFKESENNVALHSVEEQETIEHLPAQTSGWVNALA